jgi:hypothetical protein
LDQGIPPFIYFSDSERLIPTLSNEEGRQPHNQATLLLVGGSMRISRLAVIAIAFAAIAFAQETKIQRADLPPAVEKAVAAQSANAIIKGFSREKENGQTYYEAEMTVDGHSKDVLFNESGGVAEVEEQVAFDSLPAPVKEGLQSKAGQGKILKIESLTKHDKLVAYEAVVQKSGKKSEIQVSPDGKPLDHEE